MTNEEVIEVLEKEESYMLSHGGDRQAKALRITIDKIEQERKWIPVAERMPEESTAVLVMRNEIESKREEVSKKHSEDKELQAYYNGLNDGLKDARDIIDSYNEESEDKE